MIGKTIGPYQILAELGRGGMGEVYRGRDTKLNRDVAIKVLPESFAADADRVARFTREAHVLASLNHPNIAQIYGIEGDGSPAGIRETRPLEAAPAGIGETRPPIGLGVRALVMELVEGQDLSEIIGSSEAGIPLADALPIAKQIADALEAAHEQGIVHRDLKPQNIKVRADGTVKVLDFGLAKAVDPAREHSAPSTQHGSLAATMTSPAMTAMGMILGTAAYMSPEQAKGRAVDRRADIWAFGVVLCEMLTGKRLFEAEDVSETLAAVLTRDVSQPSLPPNLPPRLRSLVRDCLVRDPRQRLRDIGDARRVIESVIAGTPDDVSSSGPAVVAAAPARPRLLPLAIVGLAGAVLAGGLFTWAPWRESPAGDPHMQFTIPTPDTLGGGSPLEAAPAISPDGRLLVFPSPPTAGKPAVLWLRSIGALQAQPMPGTESASMPFWSPDSRYVGFFAGGKLKKIDVTGGPPQNLCDVTLPFGGSWNREGVILISDQGAIHRVPDAGGAPTEVVKISAAGYSLFPAFLPDGRHFIFPRFGKTGMLVGSLEGGEPAQVLPFTSRAVYVRPGFLLYVRQGTLFAQAFDLKLSQVVGDPIRVASDVASSAPTGQAAFSASDTGILVYRTGAAATARAELAWASRAGKALGTVGDVAPYRQIRISPDEKHAIIERGGALFTLDLGTRIISRFTFDEGGPTSVGDPVWSPDGRAVAFLQYGGSGNGEFFQQSLGAREVTPLFAMSGTLKFPSDWSPDGQFLLFLTLPPAKLYAGPLSGDRKPLLLAQSQRAIDSARFSPDGKWVAYNTDETGESQTWVASFPAFDNRRQVSARGGGQARWRADGRELFYLAPDGKMMSVAIVPDMKTGGLEFGAPVVLFQSPISAPNMTLDQYDVTRDGQRFLFIQPHIDPNAAPTPLAPVTVLVNWMAGIRK